MNGLSLLPSYVDYFKLNDATTGLTNAAAWIGGILGLTLVQPIPDKFGRKNGVLVATIITAVGIILMTAAQNLTMFVLGRIVIGFGTILSNLSAPALLAELLPPRNRSRILGLFFSCFYVGGLLSAIINYGTQNMKSTWAWRLPSLFQIVPSLIALSMLAFIPESPRWLIANGKDDHAKEVLIIMSGGERDDKLRDEAVDTLREIKVIIAQEAEAYPRNPWRELFSSPANRKRVYLLVVFGIMTETMGNIIARYFAFSHTTLGRPST
ncbi:hypothetical protein ABW20_dc0102471 [Dactylellina cionopaga]|nr:hypothetical protein ABW20_dc0102471 [Dactylellina cionopaga]